MANDKKVSILGCGWLGLPLAEKLLASGYQVYGSTTTPTKLNTLAEKGINPFLIDLSAEQDNANLANFLEVDYLVISFPPGIRAGNGARYLGQIEILTQALQTASVSNILFISSTSVYPDLNREVRESEDLQPYHAQNPLLQAESLIQSIPGKSTTILRMGGLVGGTRHPGRFLAGKVDVANPVAPVNLIHLADCLGLITAIFAQEKWGALYNACADEHPTRQAFYTAAAHQLNLPHPVFAPASPNDGYKIISNEKIKKELSYRFIYPDPMLFG